ncbi:MAG TPA: hypothetical protein VF817_03605 [Patescibacteria group bacterium]
MKNKQEISADKSLSDGPFGGKKEEGSADYDSAEWNFRFMHELRLRRKRVLKVLSLIALVLILSGLALWRFYFVKKAVSQPSQNKDVSVEIPANKDHVFVNDVQGVVSDSQGQNDASQPVISKAMSASEHYQIRDLSFGSGTVVLAGDSESAPLQINSVHSETLTSRDGNSIKVLVTWKTNKMAASEVSYTKGTASKTLKEGGYGFEHALILATLEQASRYTFSIKATDRWGNQVTSESYSVYTGNKPVSVFKLISGEFDEIFSWALKK